MSATPVIAGQSPPSGSSPAVALAALHRLTRSRRRGNIGLGELAYRAYVTVLLSGFGFYLALGLVDDASVGSGTIDWIRDIGPSWIGLFAAAGIAAGMRSGANGGPLAVDEAELRHVLLAPLDRHMVLAPHARRLLASAAGLGAIVGLAAGELASRQLPGGTAAWLASGALCAITIGVASTGTALLVGGTPRLRRHPGIVAAVSWLLIGWSVIDLVSRTATSPGSLIGRIAVWPMDTLWAAAAAPIVATVVAAVGLRTIGGVSIERLARRARLVRQVRFALAQQDIRSLVLLRRSLGTERPRNRPIVAAPAWFGGSRLAVPRRVLQSYLRWPTARIGRVLIGTGVAGVALAGVWRQAPALASFVAILMWLAALEVVEPFAQELDHPAMLAGAPVSEGMVHLQHLVTSGVAMAWLWAVAFGVAAAITGSVPLIELAAVTALPAGLLAAAAGGLSIKRVGSDTSDAMMMPAEMAGPQAAMRLIWPVAASGAGALPLILAVQGGDATFADGALAVVPIAIVAVLLLAWVYSRNEILASMAAAKPTTTPRGVSR